LTAINEFSHILSFSIMFHQLNVENGSSIRHYGEQIIYLDVVNAKRLEA